MVTAVILAAGESARLRSPKQMVQMAGKTLIARTIETALASRCSKVTVIVGAHAELVKSEVNPYDIPIVDNSHWREGKASSIRAAIDALSKSSAECSGILFLTCDQPYVTKDVLDQLVERFESSNETPVACAYSGILGIPAIIPRRLFPRLMQLRGDDGASLVLQSERDSTVAVEFADGSFDVDSIEDVKALAADEKPASIYE